MTVRGFLGASPLLPRGHSKPEGALSPPLTGSEALGVPCCLCPASPSLARNFPFNCSCSSRKYQIVASFPTVPTALSCPPLLLPAGGGPTGGPGRTGLCTDPGATGRCHLTFPTIPTGTESLEERKEGRMGPIWRHLLRTTETFIVFDLIIPLLGIASEEIIQKDNKKRYMYCVSLCYLQ